jgi:hypothetical protein
VDDRDGHRGRHDSNRRPIHPRSRRHRARASSSRAVAVARNQFRSAAEAPSRRRTGSATTPHLIRRNVPFARRAAPFMSDRAGSNLNTRWGARRRVTNQTRFLIVTLGINDHGARLSVHDCQKIPFDKRHPYVIDRREAGRSPLPARALTERRPAPCSRSCVWAAPSRAPPALVP